MVLNGTTPQPLSPEFDLAIEQARIQAVMAEVYKPSNLLQKVKERETAMGGLRDRFNADYRRWRLDSFKGLTEDEKGYIHYTSNGPRTFADKVMNWITTARVIIRIKNTNENEEQRRINDAKEKFAIGMLRAGDARLVRLMEPKLRAQMAFSVCIRGPLFGRATLVKAPEGTEVDITPFDPLTTTWAMGANGLDWMCHKSMKTRVQIMQEYGIDIGSDAEGHEKKGVAIYDFYDQIVNVVFMSDRDEWLKPPTLHGTSRRPPVYYAAPGYISMVAFAEVTDSISDWAESIYVADRETNEKKNFMLSTLVHLAAQSREPTMLTKSPDGSLTLDGDTNVPGAEIALTNQQDAQRLPQIEATKDLAQTIALISNEDQNATLTPVQFGNTPFALSGFALNTLRAGSEEKLDPRLETVETAILQIINLLSEQYATGFFDPISVSGRDRGNEWFDEEIGPEVIRAGGDYSVKLIAQLPQDDQTKIQMAQIARQDVNGKPLLDDRFILDDIMNIQDVDNMMDRVNAQIAERSSPMAQIWANMQAALNQDNPELALIYLNEARVLMFQQMLQTMGMVSPTLPPPPGGAEGGTPANATLLPSNVGGGGETVGIQSAPVQQAGPVVPPNTPRPGARTDATRLSDLGLAGPRG